MLARFWLTPTAPLDKSQHSAVVISSLPLRTLIRQFDATRSDYCNRREAAGRSTVHCRDAGVAALAILLRRATADADGAKRVSVVVSDHD